MNRDLDACERLYWIANQWSPNNVTAICELDGTLDLRRLSAAIRSVTAAHPLLQVRVLPDLDDCHPRFVRQGTAPLPLRRVTLSEGDLQEHLDALLEDELNRPLEAATAMARVVYADNGIRSLLAITCLHLIADATAVMVALRDLVSAYTGGAPLARQPSRAAYSELVPPLLRTGRSLPGLVPGQVSALLRRPARLPPETPVPLSERHNRVLRRELSGMSATDLKESAERHGVTVHGLLMAALALSIGEELGLRDAARARLAVGSPVSLRPYLQPAIGDELGSYVATLPCQLNVGREMDLWRVARQANQEVTRRMAIREPFALLELTRLLMPASKRESARTMQMAETAGPGNVCLSNIGRFSFPEHAGGIGVRRALWSASLSFSGYFLCSAVTTHSGLSLSFSYVEHMVSAGRAQRIVGGMLARLPVATPSASRFELRREGVA